MATREQYQIAQDIVRYANAIQDVLNFNAYALKRIHPETGGVFLKDGSPWPIEDLKDFVSDNIQSLIAYKTAIEDFVTKVGRQTVVNALTAYGIDIDPILAELISMWNAGRYVFENIPSATTDAQLGALGDYLLANVPILKLLRRRWNL